VPKDITASRFIYDFAVAGLPCYESWWDVPIAEVSESESVQKVRGEYERAVKRERHFL
jgi:3D-(3,5/4)-trihydroxycyclohexane-1,2-dione acylhydrolase (decyclizing)